MKSIVQSLFRQKYRWGTTISSLVLVGIALTLSCIAWTGHAPISLSLSTQLNEDGSVPVWLWVSVLVSVAAIVHLYIQQQSLLQAKRNYRVFPYLPLTLLPSLCIWVGRWVADAKEIDGTAMLLLSTFSIVFAQIVWDGIYHRTKQQKTVQQWSAIIAIVAAMIFACATRLDQDHFLLSALAGLLFTTAAWPALSSLKKTAEQKKGNKPHDKIPKLVYVGILLCIILVGSIHRIAGADKVTFQNDEYYHVDTGKGYAETGRYVRWDWVDDAPTDVVYYRASEYSWLTAQSIQFFGESEFAIRFPAVAFGILFILLVPIAAWMFTRNVAVATIATAIAAFDPIFLWSSNYARMYSAFTVYALTALIGFSVASMPQPLHTKPHIDRLLRLSLIALVSAFCFLTRTMHYAMMLLIPAFAFTSLLLFIKKREPRDKDALIFFALASIAALALHQLKPFIPFDLVTLHTTPIQRYLLYPFEGLLTPIIGAGACTIAVWMAYHQKQPSRWLLILVGISSSIIFYFTFLGDRYAARKYAIFIYIAVFFVIGILWNRLWNAVLKNTQWKSWSPIAAILTALFVFVPFSFPGVSPSFLIEPNIYETTAESYDHRDHRAAYRRLASRVDGNEVVYMLLPREYYLKDLHRFDYTPLPYAQTLSIEALHEMISASPEGFIVTSAAKEELHLRKEVRSYLRKSLHRFESPDTNINIYYWGNALDSQDPKIQRRDPRAIPKE